MRCAWRCCSCGGDTPAVQTGHHGVRLVPLRRTEQRCRPAAAAVAARQARGRLGHGRAGVLRPAQHVCEQVAQRLQVWLAPLQPAQASQRVAAYVGGRLRTPAPPLSSNSPLQHWPACAGPHAAQKARKVCACVPERLRARQSPRRICHRTHLSITKPSPSVACGAAGLACPAVRHAACAPAHRL